jgi:hypothetical protein
MARSDDSQYDLYQGTGGSSMRLLTLRGAGVPARERAADWEPIPGDAPPVIEFPDREIEARGFFIFKLV